MSEKRLLKCAVCDGYAGFYEQHYNQDDGFGVCANCVAWLRGRGMPEDELARLYGREGVNWGPPNFDLPEPPP